MPADLRKLLSRVAREERELIGTEVIAPVVPGGHLAVRVAGLLHRFKVRPEATRGWGIFRAGSDGVASFLRPASLTEVERYMRDLPRYRLKLAERTVGGWLGIRATADHRLSDSALYPLELVEDAQAFDVGLFRFDGSRFWFESSDTHSDPGLAEYLRDALSRALSVEDLARKGLSIQDRRLYQHVLSQTLAGRGDAHAKRLQSAVSHGGGELVGFSESASELTVQYRVEGTVYTSRVRSSDLGVLSAGVCLSGMDADFDLTSLVSVMTEANRLGMDPDE
jgi:hypothetical protein